MPKHQNHRPVSVTFDAASDAYCPACDYNLRGTSGASCPECGLRFELQRAEPPRHFLFLLGFACAAYFCTSLVYSVIYIIEFYLLYPGIQWPYLWTVSVIVSWTCTLIGVAFTFVLAAKRRAIVRASIGRQFAWIVPPVILFAISVSFDYFWWT